MPPGETYQTWMLRQLDELRSALIKQRLMSSPAPLPDARALPVVFVKGLRVDLGGQTILADVSFSIEDGELVAILGPNGAGKSTLLKVILGLVKPVPGQVSVLDRPPGGANARIGYVPQFRAIEAETTLRARDIVRFGLDGNRWGPGLAKQDSREAN